MSTPDDGDETLVQFGSGDDDPGDAPLDYSYVSLALAGQSTSSGSVAFAELILTLLALSGNSTSSGTCTLTTSKIAGAFTDFALVPNTSTAYADPALTHITSSVIRLDTAATSVWDRIGITASAPTDYAPGPAGQLYSRASFALLGLSTDALAVNAQQNISFGQFERTPGGQLTTTEQTGINLLTLEQASYEGRLYYTPDYTAIPSGATYARTNAYASCGNYCGIYTYIAPPSLNTYQNVQLYGTYTQARLQQPTYAALAYTIPPGSPAGTGPAVSVFNLVPLPQALVKVAASTQVSASVAIATVTAGYTLNCLILQYDSTMTQIGSAIVGPSVTSTGAEAWQTCYAATTLASNAAYAAVVPRVTTPSAVTSIVFYVDEHRIYSPSTVAQAAPSTLPARPWQPPRQTSITLYATRVNYAQNPGFYNDLNGYTTQLPTSVSGTLTLNTSAGFSGGNCGDFLLPTMPVVSLTGTGAVAWTGIKTSASGTPSITLLPAGRYVTVSAYVQPVQSPVPVTIWFFDGTNMVRGTSTAVQTPTGSTPYTRLSVTVQTGATFSGTGLLQIGYAASDVGALFQAITPGTNTLVWAPTTSVTTRGAWSASTTYSAADIVSNAGANWSALVQNGPWANIGPLEFRVDNVLVETTKELRPYFDGNSPSVDYMWEGTVGESRSHYYRGKTMNQYRLVSAINRQLPPGASYQLLYAPTPT